MKKFNYQNCALLIVALASASFLTCETSGAATREQPGTNPGRLIIRRAPNLGTGLFLDVSIDGVRAGAVGYGQTYDGPLSPGQHRVSVLLRPNQLFLSPTQKTVTVESGKTYVFTAMWQGQTVVLR
jgi:hypothetical protein